MAVPIQFQAGALWRLPSYLVVQLVLLRDGQFILNYDGLACSEDDGTMFYTSGMLPQRLSKATYLGSRDHAGWAWANYEKALVELSKERVNG